MREEPMVRFVDVDGVSLAAHEWAGEGDPIRTVRSAGYALDAERA